MFTIRPAVPGDAETLVDLILGLAGYERLLHDARPDAAALRVLAEGGTRLLAGRLPQHVSEASGAIAQACARPAERRPSVVSRSVTFAWMAPSTVAWIDTVSPSSTISEIGRPWRRRAARGF